MKIKTFLIILLLLFLTACSKRFKYDFDTLKEEVISAEIVEVYVLETSVEFGLINKVADEKLNDLLNDLSLIQFSIGVPPKSPARYALKLNYIDRYEVICNTYLYWFTQDDELIKGKWIRSGLDEFNELIMKYSDRS